MRAAAPHRLVVRPARTQRAGWGRRPPTAAAATARHVPPPHPAACACPRCTQTQPPPSTPHPALCACARCGGGAGAAGSWSLVCSGGGSALTSGVAAVRAGSRRGLATAAQTQAVLRATQKSLRHGEVGASEESMRAAAVEAGVTFEELVAIGEEVGFAPTEHTWDILCQEALRRQEEKSAEASNALVTGLTARLAAEIAVVQQLWAQRSDVRGASHYKRAKGGKRHIPKPNRKKFVQRTTMEVTVSAAEVLDRQQDQLKQIIAGQD